MTTDPGREGIGREEGGEGGERIRGEEEGFIREGKRDM